MILQNKENLDLLKRWSKDMFYEIFRDLEEEWSSDTLMNDRSTFYHLRELKRHAAVVRETFQGIGRGGK